MKESLPSQILNEKLPRFLQKCAQSFESDKRYRKDSRYIRVWLQLVINIYPPRFVTYLTCLKHMDNHITNLACKNQSFKRIRTYICLFFLLWEATK